MVPGNYHRWPGSDNNATGLALKKSLIPATRSIIALLCVLLIILNIFLIHPSGTKDILLKRKTTMTLCCNNLMQGFKGRIRWLNYLAGIQRFHRISKPIAIQNFSSYSTWFVVTWMWLYVIICHCHHYHQLQDLTPGHCTLALLLLPLKPQTQIHTQQCFITKSKSHCFDFSIHTRRLSAHNRRAAETGIVRSSSLY